MELDQAIITEIINALAVVLASSIAAYFSWINTKLSRNIKEQKESLRRKDDLILAKDATMSLLRHIKAEQKLRRAVRQLMRTTPIDRVLGFRAVNGLFKPERTTMIFDDLEPEYREFLGEYDFFPIDSSYQGHLYNAEKNGYEFLDVEALPVHDQMKGVYMLERVKQSLWIIAGKIDLENGRVMVVYFTFATHSDKNINTPEIIAKCRTIINLMEETINTNVRLEMESIKK